MQLTADVYRRIVNAKLYIDQNYHQPIDLGKMAGHACLSRFYFHRLFTRIYLRTPHQYLTQIRIRKATELLSGGTMAISDVCNQVGFESLGSFSVLFKKEIGYTPQHYRNISWFKKQQAAKQPQQFIPHCFIESYQLAP